MSSPEYDWRKDESQPLEDASELPLQPPLNFNSLYCTKANEIRDLTFKLYRDLHDQIGIQEATVPNFLSRLAKVADETSTFCRQLIIHNRASPDSLFREISRDGLRIINGIESGIPIRQEFLDTIKNFSNGKHVDLETKMFAQYLLDKHPRPYSTFSASLNRNFLPQDLKVKSGPLSKARKRLGKLNISFQDGINACDVELFIQQNEVTRREQYNKSRERCVDNVSRMKEMIALRDDEAKILGFLSRAKFKAESQMGSCAICIEQLIHDLRKTLVESATTRLDQLLRLKIRSLSRSRHARDLKKDTLYGWDYSFCTSLSPNGDGGNVVDWKKISDYLELNNTLTTTIRILSTLFGLKFREIHAGTPSTTSTLSFAKVAKVWQQDVKIYSVWDESHNQTGFLGYLYLDLYSRAEKSIKPGHYCLQAVSNILLIP
jgi:hypothetical protein